MKSLTSPDTAAAPQVTLLTALHRIVILPKNEYTQDNFCLGHFRTKNYSGCLEHIDDDEPFFY